MKQWLKTKLIQCGLRTKNVKFGKKTVIGLHSEFEGANRIGADSLFQGRLGYGSYIGSHASVTGKVGKYCSVGSGVQVVNGFHPIDAVSTHPAFFSLKKQCGMTYASQDSFAETKYAEPGYSVVLGNDVWIGQNAMLLAGIHIGDGAVIAAGAVVTKDVPAYTVVGGVPAKKIRDRFDADIAAAMQEIAWWNWPEEQLRANALDFADPAEFVRKWNKE